MTAVGNPTIKVVSVRQFRGLNLLEDARISDPGSFIRLENIYRRAPGVLANRPGSRVFARGDADQILGVTEAAPTTATVGNTNAQRISDLPLTATQAATVLSGSGKARGLRGVAPKIHGGYATGAPATAADPNAMSLPVATDTNLIKVKPGYVEAIHRLYNSFSQRFLIGALAFEGQGDRLFYVDNESTTPVIKLMATGNQLPSSGSRWQFVNFHVKWDETLPAFDAFVIGTSGAGVPFSIDLYPSKPRCVLMTVQRSDQFPSATAPLMHAVRSLCIYNGSVVWGGYQLRDADDGGNASDRSNFVAFSDPGEPQKIATTDGVISDIRVGGTQFEPITHVAVNSVSTDTLGTRGQLVIFTSERVAIYDGLPPVSGNPTGTAFHSVAMGTVGCVAPKTICQTDAGLMFLGTDGQVYIIPRYSASGPVPVSRTIKPVLKRLSLRQQAQCCAVFDDGQYKLSIPNGEYSARGFTGVGGGLNLALNHGSPQADVPDIQFWLDIQEPPDSSQIDFGHVWTGPHTGMRYSCFTKGTQWDDHDVVWAGSAIDGTVFQTSIEGLASDPNPVALGTAVPLVYDIRQGDMDAGDIHLDKTIRAAQYGAQVDRALNVEFTIMTDGTMAEGATLGTATKEVFTDSLTPLGTLMDGNTTMGNAVIGNPNGYRLKSKHPTVPLRGRTFNFRWRAAPAAATLFKLTDFAFVFEMHPRRD